ncbi:MAG: rubredoxin-like domain-containing protein [Promethearchaeota archaeon]|jgi:glyoxylase-like metal-dependent hydrolase (beta-lactamase superfamily II)
MKQYVCQNCGYNMIGYLPDNCPFCFASKNQFITAGECTQKYEVKSIKVNSKVSRLNSVPGLGMEHAAYQLKTSSGTVMIDCPSTFREEVEHMGVILFTHHHFLGASALYQQRFKIPIWIHAKDSENVLTRNYKFDKLFQTDFTYSEIEAFHINGHTPGFTFYIFEDILLLCDYLVGSEGNLGLNPYGPRKETLKGAKEMNRIIKDYEIQNVCGVNYVLPFPKWYQTFEQLLTD